MADPADLSNLRDIALPPDVAIWPPAPGWWILAATAVVTVGIVTLAARARYARNAYRRAALAELAVVEPASISAVLKRAALVAWPREQVAALSGPAWLALLDRTGRTTVFSAGSGRALETLAFDTADGVDVAAVRDAARTWLRTHRC